MRGLAEWEDKNPRKKARITAQKKAALDKVHDEKVEELVWENEKLRKKMEVAMTRIQTLRELWKYERDQNQVGGKRPPRGVFPLLKEGMRDRKLPNAFLLLIYEHYLLFTNFPRGISEPRGFAAGTGGVKETPCFWGFFLFKQQYRATNGA